MENQKPNNPPAFPQPIQIGGEDAGMTLRDYFAAKAMQGMLCNSIQASQGIKPYYLYTSEELSLTAYLIADAMLKARE